MDYLNLDSKERAYIDDLISKDASELTKGELNTIIDYRAAWVAKEKYYEDIQAEKDKTQAIKQAYYAQLASDAQREFDERIKSILGSGE